jgi:hypothetical protein
MAKRRTVQNLECLEQRVLLNGAVGAHLAQKPAHAVEALHYGRRTALREPTVGALGDSFTDEYRFYPPDRSHARNWVEILSDNHRANFGAFSLVSRGEPRDQGFAYNWARSDATSSGMIGNQLPGLAAQVASGKIQYAWIFIGGNDYLDYVKGLESSSSPNIGAVFTGLHRVTAQLEANFTTAVDTLLAANPNVRLVVATAPSIANLPYTKSLETSLPVKLLVDAIDLAMSHYDDLVRATAADNDRIAVDDLAASSSLLQSSTANGTAQFGGTTLNMTTPGDNYHDFFIADGIHPGTIGQGIIANSFIHTVDTTFGAHIQPLTQRAIVQFAKHVGPHVP